MNFTKITIDTVIVADIQKVWDYYNSPEHITKWNHASDDWHCPKAENDMKVGGTYLARMEAKDGSFGFDFKAIYDEIIPMAKVAYTLEDERKVVTIFEKQGEQTKVTTVFDAEGMNPIDMQKAGWQAILNNFKRYTETH
jgi:uncharacterized protein YndB with AHSA1/START domain